MKLSKIAALFMVPVLALCLVACSAPGGNVSESASSDPKIAEPGQCRRGRRAVCEAHAEGERDLFE